MNREWYDAFLKPDCLVGANTNTRKAMARNRPISDNFKHRLRPCMDNADFARLICLATGGAHSQGLYEPPDGPRFGVREGTGRIDRKRR